MSDPVRLRDAGDGEVSALLRHAKPSAPASAAARARAARRVAKVAAMPVAAASGLALSAKLAAAMALAGVVAVGGRAVPRLVAELTATHAPTPAAPAAPGGPAAAPRATDVVPSIPPRDPVVPTAPELPTAPAVSPVPTVPAALTVPAVATAPSAAADRSHLAPVAPAGAGPRGAPPPVALAPAGPGDALAAETALLAAARGSLDSDPAAALARLDEHARAYPKGALAEERDVLRVEALCRAGRFEEGRRRGDALLAVHPAGLYASRLRTLLHQGCPAE